MSLVLAKKTKLCCGWFHYNLMDEHFNVDIHVVKYRKYFV